MPVLNELSVPDAVAGSVGAGTRASASLMGSAATAAKLRKKYTDYRVAAAENGEPVLPYEKWIPTVMNKDGTLKDGV